MQIFYVPGITGDSCVMDESESRHCIRVLRMTKGDRVKLVDGMGGYHEGIITGSDPSACRIRITDSYQGFEKREYRLHMAVSPIKNQERFEWFIEKSVELGIDEITPLICRNTEKKGIKTDRINNIIISAMKQSLKAYKPLLNEALPFGKFIAAGHSGIKMIAHCNRGFESRKMDLIYRKGMDALILIGPEGDFSMEEIDLALSSGFKGISLGNSRLRTETAGIAACHSVYFINQ
ncbi:MAG: 16S rRNA (uracil(1498)-N(3))-methyltransferase [Bacteroidales bacterium]|jgi:16S rRNA (uracil1498-N3)-methyltransferase|nr:16S rRNA (uracil(1498)-N(3))-methyltransferase [Bacteroidales bacterium]NLK54179.1 16S rRNA (uracil(1498)-N(3))-methyltransferase [Bacteroidales bacterium]HPX42854.1 16S rRNA (uracil(1498)-N(3))-methyltransferase [Bacteroidales bacterium]HQB85515.1 16S rRNA (uracil(1498)-N(3))-methyltransferase [Bacteroidales bacterium]